MTTQARDTNASSIPALHLVGTATNVSTATHSVTIDGVARIASTAGCTYGLGVAASILLPAGAVEYVAVQAGQDIQVVGIANILVV